jgi:hypothetical protein
MNTPLMIFELIISGALMTLIWMIQILHYPSFKFIDKSAFSEFEEFHTNRISLIVIPLMLTEVLLLFLEFRLLIFFIVLLIWMSTFILQVPCHNKLKSGQDVTVIERLISTNWIRTILWTIKFFILVSLTQWQIG